MFILSPFLIPPDRKTSKVSPDYACFSSSPPLLSFYLQADMSSERVIRTEDGESLARVSEQVQV